MPGVAHYKVVCKKHKKVMEQCRCPGPKSEFKVPCDYRCPDRFK